MTKIHKIHNRLRFQILIRRSRFRKRRTEITWTSFQNIRTLISLFGLFGLYSSYQCSKIKQKLLTCAFVRYLQVEPLNSILYARATQRFRLRSLRFPPHCTIPQNDKPKWNSIAFSAFYTVRGLRDHQNPI